MDKDQNPDSRGSGLVRRLVRRLGWNRPGRRAVAASTPSLTSRLAQAAVLLGLSAALVGAGHLVAWLGGYLTREGLTAITMKTNTALCLTLVGVALVLLVPARPGRARRWGTRACALLAFLVGLLTIGENLSGWNLGIDQLLANEMPGALAVTSPNRMGLPASLGFVLIGLSLLLLSRRSPRRVRVAQGLALVVCLVGLLPTIGFLYGAREFYGIARYTGIAWPTALMLLLMGIGLLCARPAEGLMAQVTAGDPGGVSIRRLLPAFVILPLMLGWLRLAGERHGLFDAPMGTGMMMLLFIVLFTALTYHAGGRASRAAWALRESRERLQATFDHAGVGLVEVTTDDRIIAANDRLCQILGYERSKLLGKTIHELTAPEDRAHSDLLNQQLHEGHTGRIDYEKRYLKRDGSPLWVHVTVSAIHDDQGRWQRSIATIEDISARRQAEAYLRRYELLSAHTRDILLFLRREDGRILEANTAAANAYGYSRDELLELTIHDLRAPDQREEVAGQLAQADEGGILFETVHRRKDGSMFPVEVSAQAATIEGTRTLISVIRDITERKQAQQQQEHLLQELKVRAWEQQEANERLATINEELAATNEELRVTTEELHNEIEDRKQAQKALRDRERRLRVFFESDMMGTLFWNMDGQITDANDKFLRMVGYSREDLITGRVSWAQMTPPQYREQDEYALEELRTTGVDTAYEKEYVRKDGTRIPILIGAAMLDERRYEGVAFVLDITERKRAEEALQTSRQMLETVVNYMPASVTLIRGSDLRLQLVNPAYQAIAPGKEMVGRTLDELWPETGREFAALCRRVLETGEAYEVSDELNMIRRRPDGPLEAAYFSWSLHRVRLPGDEGWGLLNTAWETTARKEAELALRRSEARWNAAIEHFAEGAIIATEAEQVVYWNPAARVLHGFASAQEGIGPLAETPITFQLWTPDGRHLLELDEWPMRRIKRGETVRNLELRLRRPDQGWEKIVSYSGAMVETAGGERLIFLSVHDLTRQREAEKALREWNTTLESRVAQRTAELEQRTRQLQRLTLELSQAEERERRRIAVLLHEDLQQQIAGAKFHLSLVRRRSRDDALRAHVDKVDEMLTGAVETSRTLSHDLSPAVVHMKDLTEVLPWLAHRVNMQQGLKVRVDFSGDMTLHSEALALFLFRAAQEMLFNVVKHARVEEAAIRVRRWGRYVGLSVSDRGRGFTPRELKETAGVGLFSLRERTELLGGRMTIKSAKGQGSRLRITVPDDLKPQDMPRTTDNGQRRAPSRSESSAILRSLSAGPPLRVLLVDDHDIVREGLAALLHEAPDITVIGEAADGRAAIDLATDLEPDVVVMDVSMPLMSGDQATRQIKAHRPQTRVIALSMFDEADQKERMYQAGAESYVLKTASSDELLAAIRGRTAK